jgi:hypothetical protein
MASEAASYREDVEQARRRFVEFRETHAARSRLPWNYIEQTQPGHNQSTAAMLG